MTHPHLQGQPRSVGSGTLVSESWGGRVTPFRHAQDLGAVARRGDGCPVLLEFLIEESELLNPMGHELIVHGQLGSCYLGFLKGRVKEGIRT